MYQDDDEVVHEAYDDADGAADEVDDSERDTFACPNCEAEVSMVASVCPECGSDDETGWSLNTIYDDLDLPDDSEDGDGDGAEEGSGSRQGMLSTFVLAVVVILIIMAAVMGVG